MIESTRRERRRRRRIWPALVLVAVGALLFALGLGLGRALEQNPEPGGDRTVVRTLEPLPLAPARETVTVTVTAP